MSRSVESCRRLRRARPHAGGADGGAGAGAGATARRRHRRNRTRWQAARAADPSLRRLGVRRLGAMSAPVRQVQAAPSAPPQRAQRARAKTPASCPPPAHARGRRAPTMSATGGTPSSRCWMSCGSAATASRSVCENRRRAGQRACRATGSAGSRWTRRTRPVPMRPPRDRCPSACGRRGARRSAPPPAGILIPGRQMLGDLRLLLTRFFEEQRDEFRIRGFGECRLAAHFRRRGQHGRRRHGTGGGAKDLRARLACRCAPSSARHRPRARPSAPGARLSIHRRQCRLRHCRACTTDRSARPAASPCSTRRSRWHRRDDRGLRRKARTARLHHVLQMLGDALRCSATARVLPSISKPGLDAAASDPASCRSPSRRACRPRSA